MWRRFYIGAGLLLALANPLFAADNQTRDLAQHRAAIVGDVAYKLFFDLKKNTDHYQATTDITFSLSDPGQDLTIDFKGREVKSVTANDKAVTAFRYLDSQGQLVLPAASLVKGVNTVHIAFIGEYSKTGTGFHHFKDPSDNQEYLYSDFQPANAHAMFPCFDQPNLKASYALAVKAPTDWRVISNAPIANAVPDGMHTLTQFRPTARFSTYLFHLSAGPYAVFHDSGFRVPMAIYCRASLAKHMDADVMFASTRKGLTWFEDYFGITYPYQKYDQIFEPEYNAGAMENVGAVTFNESYIFKSKPSPARLLRRDVTIMHELAHMWFGNLVTMTWWNDLWLNESFATYMSFLALESMGHEDIWTHSSRRKDSAYREDQKVTTHPILADVPDVRTAGSIFDSITYGKGFAVLRQLGYYLGPDNFRSGVKLYFKQHAGGNTTLPDFVAALNESSNRDLTAWFDQWVKTQDVNTMRLKYEVAGGKIQNARVLQYPGKSNDILRRHATDVALYYQNEDGTVTRGQSVQLVYSGAEDPATQLNGLKAPLFMLPNEADHDYVKVQLDPISLDWILANIDQIQGLSTKNTIWRYLWDMVQEQQLTSHRMIELVMRRLEKETDPTILRRLIGYTNRIVYDYIPRGADRLSYENRIFDIAHKQLQSDLKGGHGSWYDMLTMTAKSSQQLDILAKVFSGDITYPGLELPARRKWWLVNAMVVAGDDRAEAMIAKMTELDTSASGKNQLLLLAALKSTAEAKQKAWQDLTHGNFSNREYRSLAMGFMANAGEIPFMKDYISKYFEYLPKAFESEPWLKVRGFTWFLFPAYGDHETVKHAESFLNGDNPKPIQEMILEEVNDLKKILAIRDAWKSNT